MAAHYLKDTASYSRTLARVALEVVGRQYAVAGIPMARTSRINGRLRRLARTIHPSRLARKWVALSILGGLVFLMAIGGLKLVYAEPAAVEETTTLTPSTPPESVVVSEESTNKPQPPARVLHFPADRSLGQVMERDDNYKHHIDTFYNWTGEYESWQYLGEAQGDIAIPRNKHVKLTINKSALADLSPLLNLGSDDIHTLIMPYFREEVDLPWDACMPHVAHLTGLRQLDLTYTKITRMGLAHLEKLTALERLAMPKATTDKGLAHIAALPSLKELKFGGRNQITNGGLAQLANAQAIEELTIGGKYISDAGLAPLTRLPSLRYLILWGNTLGDDALIHVRNIPSLRILNLGNGAIGDVGLAHLAGHAGLEHLNLYGTQVTDAGMVHLKKMRSLKKLNLMNTQVTDHGLIHLKEIRSLEHLNLPNFGITDAGLAHMSEMTNLKYLWAGGSSGGPITDAGIEHVTKLHALEELCIGGRGITDAGLEQLTKLTNLEKLSLISDSETISNNGMASLAKIKPLKHLSLSGNLKLSMAGLNHLNALANSEFLGISTIEQDGAGLDLSGLTRLEKLALSLRNWNKPGGHRFRDEDMAGLANLKNLKWLQGAYGIGDAGMAHLAGLTQMERFGAGGPRLTDAGLAYMDGMKKLDHLSLKGNFTDAGMRQFEKHKSLGYLRVESEQAISPAAVERLHALLPNLPNLNINGDTGDRSWPGQ